jgi:tRNA nucleotidyltransferase (CCA-adding enzyme)
MQISNAADGGGADRDIQADARKFLGNVVETFGREPVDICRALMAAGHDAVIVGGPVRDALMGGHPNDVDIATSATPDQVRALFQRTFVQGQGERHGTIGVLGDSDETYEVTTYRLDVETDGRHAQVQFTTSLEEDLARRDFTINAMAVRVSPDGSGQLVDPFGGQRDLHDGELRTVGAADQRFAEDFLRILRAYRFAARFAMNVEEATRAAIRSNAQGLDGISPERVRDELMKLSVQGKDATAIEQAVLAMQDDGVLPVILPELARVATDSAAAKDDRFRSSVAASARAAEATRDPRFFLALLLHRSAPRESSSDDPAAAAAEVVRSAAARLKMSNAESDWIIAAAQHHLDLERAEEALTRSADQAGRMALGSILRELRYVSLEDLVVLEAMRSPSSTTPSRAVALQAQMARLGTVTHIAGLAISGNDLIAAGIKPGPRLGLMLKTLLDDVIHERVRNTHEALLARVHAVIEEAPDLGRRAAAALGEPPHPPSPRRR